MLLSVLTLLCHLSAESVGTERGGEERVGLRLRLCDHGQSALSYLHPRTWYFESEQDCMCVNQSSLGHHGKAHSEAAVLGAGNHRALPGEEA